MENYGTTALRPQSPWLAHLRALTVSKSTGEFVAVLVLTPLLLAIAVWNGFPIIFYDTGAYILEGLGHVFVAERAPVYSLFLDFAGAGLSLWFIAILQCALTAYVIVEVARTEVPGLSVLGLVGVVAGLLIVSGVGWYTGQIEPDCMTALLVLSLYLLIFRQDALDSTRTIVLGGIASFAIACHPAHLPLAAALLLGALALRILFHVVPTVPKPDFAAALSAFAVAISLVLLANYNLTQKWFVSRSGPVFVFARLLQDGIAQRVLHDTCPQSHYVLCRFQSSLPHRADAWLWDANSPFNKLDRFNGPVKEYEQIALEGLVRYPVLNLVAAARDSALQFLDVRTGDQIEPQEWILYPDLAHYLPNQMDAYMRARQQQGEIRFAWLNRIHVTVAFASLLGLGFLLWSAMRRRNLHDALLPGFVFLALLANAVVCGTLSNPHDRYQSRLMWVPVFVVAISIAGRHDISLRRTVESGT